MSNAQIKRAEHAIAEIRERGESGTADTMQELIEIMRTLEGRIADLERENRAKPAKAMDLPG
jgi:pyridoxal biosynthesis lyase PdxS